MTEQERINKNKNIGNEIGSFAGLAAGMLIPGAQEFAPLISKGAGLVGQGIGSLFSEGGGLNIFPDSAGSHANNPYGGLPLGGKKKLGNAGGGLDLVEGGETSFTFKDENKEKHPYIFPKNLAGLTKSLANSANPKNPKALNNPLRPKDSYTEQYLNENALLPIAQKNELDKTQNELNQVINSFGDGGFNVSFMGGPMSTPLAQTQDIKQPITYGKGGGIHINPANKGKFNATKKATGKTTEELTHSKNPLTRKRAVFAQNAAKWHHKDGGYINGNSNVMTKGGPLEMIGQYNNLFVTGGGIYKPTGINDEIDLNLTPESKGGAQGLITPTETKLGMFDFTDTLPKVNDNTILDPKAREFNPALTKEAKSKTYDLDELSQLAGPVTQLAYGLRGADDVNYERMNVSKINPYYTAALARKAAAQQMNAQRNLNRQIANTQGTQLAYDLEGANDAYDSLGMLTGNAYVSATGQNIGNINTANQVNTTLSQKEREGRQREVDAARNAITNSLYNGAANYAGIRKTKKEIAANKDFNKKGMKYINGVYQDVNYDNNGNIVYGKK